MFPEPVTNPEDLKNWDDPTLKAQWNKRRLNSRLWHVTGVLNLLSFLLAIVNKASIDILALAFVALALYFIGQNKKVQAWLITETVSRRSKQSK